MKKIIFLMFFVSLVGCASSQKNVTSWNDLYSKKEIPINQNIKEIEAEIFNK